MNYIEIKKQLEESLLYSQSEQCLVNEKISLSQIYSDKTEDEIDAMARENISASINILKRHIQYLEQCLKR